MKESLFGLLNPFVFIVVALTYIADDPFRDSLFDAGRRFVQSVESMSNSGVDPIALSILVLIGLYIFTNYRLKMYKLKDQYNRGLPLTDDEKRESASTSASPDNLASLLSLFADNSAAMREMAAAVTVSSGRLSAITDNNQQAHRIFEQKAQSISSGIDGFSGLLGASKTEILGAIAMDNEKSLKVGICLFDNDAKLVGWNGEGREVFGKDEESSLSLVGKSVDVIGPNHNKCLGSNLTLFEIIKLSKKKNKTQVDILELSFSHPSGGKWDWHLIFVVPFFSSTLLILLDVGDIQRGAIVESPIKLVKAIVKKPIKAKIKKDEEGESEVKDGK